MRKRLCERVAIGSVVIVLLLLAGYLFGFVDWAIQASLYSAVVWMVALFIEWLLRKDET